jgi:hypothetical protein
MERMIESYGSDKNAKDLCRVLRVPGFLNRKHAIPHQVRIVASPGWRYSRSEILAAFPPVERRQTKANGHATPSKGLQRDDSEDRRIRDALFSIPADERHVWLTMGMAIESHYGDAGRALWDEWSLTAKDKYDERDQDKTWRSFKGSGVTIATLFHYAKHGGWEDATQRLYEEWCRKHKEERKDASVDLGEVFTFLGDTPVAAPKELIKKLLPAYGVAVTGGQSTAGKTFIQIHKSICLATPRPYFDHRIVERVGTVFIGLGIDDDGEAYGSCAVVPAEGKSRFDKAGSLSKTQRALQDAISEVMDGQSEFITPRAGLTPVRAVRVADLRKDFDRRYVTDETDPVKASEAKRKAFKRALDRLSPDKFGAGSSGGTDWIWRHT